jgi:hypothetical protein
MTRRDSTKDLSLQFIIDVIEQDLGPAVRTCDLWEADSFAIGFVSRDRPSRRVYVSTWEQAPERCWYECEDGEDVLQKGVATVDGLRLILMAHLLHRAT